jgi:hypothetical protein
MADQYFQSLDPAGAPDPVTPAGSPSNPSGYAQVTPHGRGPAPYDIQAASDEGTVQAAFDGSVAVSGAGVLYTQSPRQAAAEALLNSPPGYQDFDIYGGFSGEGATTHGWPNDVGPGADAETPIQGMGDFTGTGTV